MNGPLKISTDGLGILEILFIQVDEKARGKFVRDVKIQIYPQEVTVFLTKTSVSRET